MNKEIHHQHMIKILIDIYKDPFLSRYLYFKGGTAFYLFYDLPRFSTDLDFEVSKECPEQSEVLERLRKIIKKYGEVREALIKRNTIFLVLRYQLHARLLKIEASRREFLEDYEVKNIFGVDIKLLKLDILCAHKLVALTERIKARDLFDAYYILLNRFPINEKIIELRTKKSRKEFFKYLKGKVEKNFSRNNVLHELGEVIEENKKNWIRDRLKAEVIALIIKEY